MSTKKQIVNLNYRGAAKHSDDVESDDIEDNDIELSDDEYQTPKYVLKSSSSYERPTSASSEIESSISSVSTLEEVDEENIKSVLNAWVTKSTIDPMLHEPLEDKWLHCYWFINKHLISMAGDSKNNQVISKLLQLLATLLKGCGPYIKKIFLDSETVKPLSKKLRIKSLDQLVLVLKSLHVETKTLDWMALSGNGVVEGNIWRLDHGRMVADLTFAPHYISAISDRGVVYNDSSKIAAFLKNKTQRYRSSFFVSCALFAKYVAFSRNVSMAFPEMPEFEIDDHPFSFGVNSNILSQYICICQQFAGAKVTPSAIMDTEDGSKVLVALSDVVSQYIQGIPDCKSALDAARKIRVKTVLDTIMKEIHPDMSNHYSLNSKNAYTNFMSVVAKFEPVKAKILAIQEKLQRRDKKCALVYIGVTKTGPNYQYDSARRFAEEKNITFIYGDIQLYGDDYVDATNEVSVREFLNKHKSIEGCGVYVHLDISDDSVVNSHTSIPQAVSAILAYKSVVALSIKGSAFEDYTLPGQAAYLVDADNKFVGVRPHNGEVVIYVLKASGHTTQLEQLADNHNDRPVAVEWRKSFVRANANRGFYSAKLTSVKFDVLEFSPIIKMKGNVVASFKKKESILLHQSEAKPVDALIIQDVNKSEVWLAIQNGTAFVTVSDRAVLLSESKLKDVLKSNRVVMGSDMRYVVTHNKQSLVTDLSSSFGSNKYDDDEDVMIQ